MKAETALESAIKQITFLEAKTDDLENQGRRKNLSIFGIRARAEGNQSLYDFFTNMLPKWLGLPPQKSFTLERVHRTLTSGKPNQNSLLLKIPREEVCQSGSEETRNHTQRGSRSHLHRTFLQRQSVSNGGSTSMPSVDSYTTPTGSGSCMETRCTSFQHQRKPKCSTKNLHMTRDEWVMKDKFLMQQRKI